MKLFINLSNIQGGGAHQVAVSFLSELSKINANNDYWVVYNPSLKAQVKKLNLASRFASYEVDNSPSTLLYHFKIVHQLDKWVTEFSPDIVFTLFGPTSWKPKVKHLCGFGNSLFLYPKELFNSILPVKARILNSIIYRLKLLNLKRESRYFVVEADHVKQQMIKRMNLSSSHIWVVGNTCSGVFYNEHQEVFKYVPRFENEYRLLVITSFYPHKNIAILKAVCERLHQLDITNIRFFISVTEELLKKNRMYHPFIIPLGNVPHEKLPSLYEQIDATFAPTLIESFTAVYPESMKMGKPILTSDLFFAHDLCQDAALYFDPLNAEDIVEKIINLYHSSDEQQKLVAKGKEVMKSFLSAEKRAKRYIEICEFIVNHNE